MVETVIKCKNPDPKFEIEGCGREMTRDMTDGPSPQTSLTKHLIHNTYKVRDRGYRILFIEFHVTKL